MKIGKSISVVIFLKILVKILSCDRSQAPSPRPQDLYLLFDTHSIFFFFVCFIFYFFLIVISFSFCFFTFHLTILHTRPPSWPRSFLLSLDDNVLTPSLGLYLIPLLLASALRSSQIPIWDDHRANFIN